MSRSYYKGSKTPRKDKKKWLDKKFFGYTDGAHSRSEEKIPTPFVHYVKYGWKQSKNSQHKSILKNKQIKDE